MKVTNNNIVFMMSVTSLLASAALAAPPNKPKATSSATAAKAEPAICLSLMDEYEMASKKLAYNEALGSSDDSAMRATMRETENNTILNQARFTMELMHNNGCTGPTYAPNWRRYAFASLKCSTALQRARADRAVARLRGSSESYAQPPECDLWTWTPDQ